MRVFLFSRKHACRHGFSILELLAVCAMITILASLLLVAATKAKNRAASIQCVNNLKELQLAAHLYSVDHNDFLPPNGWAHIEWSDGCPQGYQSAAGSWVMGDASTDRTETGIRNGVLFPYVKKAEAYHCPSDRSMVDRYKILRKRSYSASYYMNGSKVTGYAQVKAKFSEIRDPATKFVYLDEHENTIDDGVFFLHLPGDKGEQAASQYPENHMYGAHWMSAPSNRHNKGGNLSFADGSVSNHHWKWQGRMLTVDADRSANSLYDFEDLRGLQSGIPDVNVQWIVAAGANGPGHE